MLNGWIDVEMLSSRPLVSQRHRDRSVEYIGCKCIVSQWNVKAFFGREDGCGSVERGDGGEAAKVKRGDSETAKGRQGSGLLECVDDGRDVASGARIEVHKRTRGSMGSASASTQPG